jgi:hypothetical protein
MTTYWSIRKQRSKYPLFNIMLQMLALVQLRYNVLVTIGHIEGKRNIHSDAISRDFEVQDAAAILAFLNTLPHYRIGPALTRLIVLLAMLPWNSPLQILRAAHIALESLTGLVSALSSTNLSMPLVTSPSRSS